MYEYVKSMIEVIAAVVCLIMLAVIHAEAARGGDPFNEFHPAKEFAEQRDLDRIRGNVPLEERIEAALDKTGFTSLSMDDQIRVVYFTGLLTEQAGKVTPNVGLSSFGHSALRQFGVQLQVAAMHRRGVISNNPAVAFLQGFSVGL